MPKIFVVVESFIVDMVDFQENMKEEHINRRKDGQTWDYSEVVNRYSSQ